MRRKFAYLLLRHQVKLSKKLNDVVISSGSWPTTIIGPMADHYVRKADAFPSFEGILIVV